MTPILLVDDVEAARAIALLFLQGLPCETHEAASGGEALERFAATSYALVLMDLEMPGMHGLDAVRAMRALETAQGRARTPILALTAHDGPGQALEALSAGFDEILVKPFTRQGLRDAVSARLPRA